MDLGLRILSLLTIPLTLLLFFMMARMAGREMQARKRTYLMGVLMPALMLLVNGIFLSAGFNLLCAAASFLFFLGGIALGIWTGSKARMDRRDEGVVAKRSALPVILWAVSYAVTQLFTTAIPSSGAGVGVTMMFLSTGAAIGMNANLLRRYLQVKA